MEQDGQTYLLPNPLFARIIMIGCGLFALIISPWALWQGVWPLNITTPIFGFIMLGGMSVGAAFLRAGLIVPSARMRFTPGMIELNLDFLWGSSKTVIRVEDIDNFCVEERTNTDGPNDWYAVIKLKDGKELTSRPIETKKAADACLVEWRGLVSP